MATLIISSSVPSQTPRCYQQNSLVADRERRVAIAAQQKFVRMCVTAYPRTGLLAISEVLQGNLLTQAERSKIIFRAYALEQQFKTADRLRSQFGAGALPLSDEQLSKITTPEAAFQAIEQYGSPPLRLAARLVGQNSIEALIAQSKNGYLELFDKALGNVPRGIPFKQIGEERFSKLCALSEKLAVPIKDPILQLKAIERLYFLAYFFGVDLDSADGQSYLLLRFQNCPDLLRAIDRRLENLEEVTHTEGAFASMGPKKFQFWIDFIAQIKELPDPLTTLEGLQLIERLQRDPEEFRKRLDRVTEEEDFFQKMEPARFQFLLELFEKAKIPFTIERFHAVSTEAKAFARLADEAWPAYYPGRQREHFFQDMEFGQDWVSLDSMEKLYPLLQKKFDQYLGEVQQKSIESVRESIGHEKFDWMVDFLHQTQSSLDPLISSKGLSYLEQANRDEGTFLRMLDEGIERGGVKGNPQFFQNMGFKRVNGWLELLKRAKFCPNAIAELRHIQRNHTNRDEVFRLIEKTTPNNPLPLTKRPEFLETLDWLFDPEENRFRKMGPGRFETADKLAGHPRELTRVLEIATDTEKLLEAADKTLHSGKEVFQKIGVKAFTFCAEFIRNSGLMQDPLTSIEGLRFVERFHYLAQFLDESGVFPKPLASEAGLQFIYKVCKDPKMLANVAKQGLAGTARPDLLARLQPEASFVERVKVIERLSIFQRRAQEFREQLKERGLSDGEIVEVGTIYSVYAQGLAQIDEDALDSMETLIDRSRISKEIAKRSGNLFGGSQVPLDAFKKGVEARIAFERACKAASRFNAKLQTQADLESHIDLLRMLLSAVHRSKWPERLSLQDWEFLKAFKGDFYRENLRNKIAELEGQREKPQLSIESALSQSDWLDPESPQLQELLSVFKERGEVSSFSLPIATLYELEGPLPEDLDRKTELKRLLRASCGLVREVLTRGLTSFNAKMVEPLGQLIAKWERILHSSAGSDVQKQRKTLSESERMKWTAVIAADPRIGKDSYDPSSVRDPEIEVPIEVYQEALDML